jgi:hypothetical protein
MGKPQENRQMGKPAHRWEDNTKMNLRGIRWGGMEWINLAG